MIETFAEIVWTKERGGVVIDHGRQRNFITPLMLADIRDLLIGGNTRRTLADPPVNPIKLYSPVNPIQPHTTAVIRRQNTDELDADSIRIFQNAGWSARATKEEAVVTFNCVFGPNMAEGATTQTFEAAALMARYTSGARTVNRLWAAAPLRLSKEPRETLRVNWAIRIARGFSAIVTPLAPGEPADTAADADVSDTLDSLSATSVSFTADRSPSFVAEQSIGAIIDNIRPSNLTEESVRGIFQLKLDGTELTPQSGDEIRSTIRPFDRDEVQWIRVHAPGVMLQKGSQRFFPGPADFDLRVYRGQGRGWREIYHRRIESRRVFGATNQLLISRIGWGDDPIPYIWARDVTFFHVRIERAGLSGLDLAAAPAVPS